MTGLSGLLFTSATGAKTTWMPRARAASAVARARRSARSRSPVAATAIAEGPKTRSGKRIPGPASRSAATRSGTFAFAARRWFRSAVSSGVERNQMTPPIPSSETSRARSRYSGSSSAR